MLDRYETDVVLTDGGTVHVRPIRPDDAERLVTFFDGLSRETVYYRFFSPKHSLSEKEVTYFTVLDYVDRFALVALLDHELVGVARYDRLDPGDRAEVAFVIDDRQQGRGLGTVLLEHLAQAGQDAAIAPVHRRASLPDNGRMLASSATPGWKVARRFEDGVIQVEFPIDPHRRHAGRHGRAGATGPRPARSSAILAPRLGRGDRRQRPARHRRPRRSSRNLTHRRLRRTGATR